jgi:SAM-dependent methyltransferase
MTHEEKIARWIGRGKIGVEIGAFKSPVPGLVPPPFYVDCFKEFGFEPVHADYYGHATSLPFRDNSLDYVVTSHVLEHVANPIAALAEWYRVLRPGGIIYLLVPDRRFTWDHPRPLTTVEHFLDDFERGTTPADATHIDDFALGLDWSQFSPATPAVEIPAQRATLARGMHEAVARGEHLNIHFHTFEPANLRALIERLRTWPRTRFNWMLLETAERFPSSNPIGCLAVIRVDKTWRDRVAGWRTRRATARDPKFPLRADAQPFAEFARTCAGLGGVR